MFKHGIFKINSFDIALLDKRISKFTEHTVFALRSIRKNIAPMDCNKEWWAIHKVTIKIPRKYILSKQDQGDQGRSPGFCF